QGELWRNPHRRVRAGQGPRRHDPPHRPRAGRRVPVRPGDARRDQGAAGMNAPATPSPRIALVTGATRGIGAAIAAELAARGCTVIGTATTDEGAARIGAALAARGGRGVRLDVTDGAAVEALVESIAKEDGGLHILVNNAGITRDTLAMRMKDAD